MAIKERRRQRQITFGNEPLCSLGICPGDGDAASVFKTSYRRGIEKEKTWFAYFYSHFCRKWKILMTTQLEKYLVFYSVLIFMFGFFDNEKEGGDFQELL